jgi:hypothetical protein
MHSIFDHHGRNEHVHIESGGNLEREYRDNHFSGHLHRSRDGDDCNNYRDERERLGHNAHRRHSAARESQHRDNLRVECGHERVQMQQLKRGDE